MNGRAKSSPSQQRRTLTWKRHGLPVILSLSIGLAIYAACIAFWAAGKFQYVELPVYDWLIRAQSTDRRAADQIVIVGIDELDLRALGHYPLTDFEKADLFERLLSLGATAVGSDLYLDLPAPDPRAPDGRQRLNHVLLARRNIICPELFADGSSVGIFGPDVLTKPFRARRIGAVDQPVDHTDGTIRKAFVYLGGGSQRTAPALSIGVANQFLEADGTLPIDKSDPLHLNYWRSRLPRTGPNDGAYVGADSAGWMYLVDYKGPADFATIRLRQVLPSLSRVDAVSGEPGLPDLTPDALRGKVVFVGMMAESVKDLISTPVSFNRFGVKQHATLFDQLIRTAKYGAQPLRSCPNWTKALLGMLWVIAGVVAGSRIRSAPWLFGIMSAGLAVHALSVYLLFLAGFWIPAVAPAVCWLLSAGSVTAAMRHLERDERNVLMGIFGKAVAPRIANELWNNREHLVEHGGLKPQVITATILFSDLENFTTLSEKMPPAELIDWLNAYIGKMAAVVESCDGVVAKYMGDSVMAMFGALRYRDDSDAEGIAQDAQRTVECALEMRHAMATLSAGWIRRQEPCPRMRIGILTGRVVAGSLGSRDRLEYVTLGDTTNTASRLESYDKELMDEDISANGCRILIGEPTQVLVSQLFESREIGRIQLKGKQSLVGVFGVVGRRVAPPSSVPSSEPAVALGHTSR